jgi:hypothetical protein
MYDNTEKFELCSARFMNAKLFDKRKEFAIFNVRIVAKEPRMNGANIHINIRNNTNTHTTRKEMREKKKQSIKYVV